MKHLLISSLLAISCVQAETVVWTATGSVTETQGVFDIEGLDSGDPVNIRFSYNDQAGRDRISSPGFGQFTEDYRIDIDLTITITIGEMTWEGNVGTGIADPPLTSPYTLLVDSVALGGNESFAPELRMNDGANFTSFPLKEVGDNNSILLNFRATSTTTFIGSGITTADIDPTKITSATGSINTGNSGSTLSFSIDPSTVAVMDEAPPLEAPLVEITPQGFNFELSWEAVNDVTYSVQKSSTLLENSWEPVEDVTGTGALVARSYSREGTILFYRVVATGILTP